MPVYMNLRRYVDKKIAEIGSGENTGSGTSIPKFPTPQDLPVTNVIDGQIAIVLSLDHIFLYDEVKGWVDTDITSGEVGLTKDETDTYYAPINHTHAEFADFATKTELSGKANTGDSYTKNEADTKFALKGEGGSGGGASIDDSVASTTTTYSSQKIADELGAKADTTNVYGKTETYSQTEVNDLLADKADTSALEGKANTADVYSKLVADSTFASKSDIIPTYVDTDSFPTPTIEGQAVIDESTGLIYVAKTVATTPGVASPSDVSLIPKMTKNNLPSPYVAWASKELSTTNTAAFKAFDQLSDAESINNYFWTGNSRGTNIDWLAVGRTDQKMTFNRISVESSAAGGTNYPASATVQISDNQVDWIDVMNVPNMGLTAGDQVYIIDLPEVVSAKYVRLYNLKATGYSGGSGPVVKEMKVIRSGGLQWVEADFVKKIKKRTRIETTATNALSITSTARQIVPFDNVGADLNAEYDKTTYKVTIKESGFYHIDAQLWLTYLAQGRYAVAGYMLNSIERRTSQIVGAQLAPSDGSSGYPAPQTVGIRESLWLNAGDTIQIFVLADCKTGDTTSVSNTSTTRFTLNRLY